jgi:hypothetical protein
VRAAMRGTGKHLEQQLAAYCRRSTVSLSDASRTHARTDRQLARSTAKYLVLDSLWKF